MGRADSSRTSSMQFGHQVPRTSNNSNTTFCGNQSGGMSWLILINEAYEQGESAGGLN